MDPTHSIDPALFWIGAMALILSFGTAIWNVFSSPAKRAESRISEIVGRMDRLELRSQRIEDRVAQFPTTQQLHELELSMQRTQGQIEVLNERLRPVAAIGERMQEWMLENGK